MRMTKTKTRACPMSEPEHKMVTVADMEELLPEICECLLQGRTTATELVELMLQYSIDEQIMIFGCAVELRTVEDGV